MEWGGQTLCRCYTALWLQVLSACVLPFRPPLLLPLSLQLLLQCIPDSAEDYSYWTTEHVSRDAHHVLRVMDNMRHTMCYVLWTI